jgi:hypothetical protein
MGQQHDADSGSHYRGHGLEQTANRCDCRPSKTALAVTDAGDRPGVGHRLDNRQQNHSPSTKIQTPPKFPLGHRPIKQKQEFVRVQCACTGVAAGQ